MTSDLYFGKDVDEAIVSFCKSPSQKEKSFIFEKRIYPAFKKLSFYHYNKLPVIKNQESVDECVVFLYEQLYKFDPSKQTRGFPYFNIIAKHYFIQKIKQEKRAKLHDETRLVSLSDESTDDTQLLTEDYNDQITKEQFFDVLRQHLPIWRDKFVKPQEKQVVECLITLFAEPESVEIFKKKAVLLYLKEMTGMNAKQIASNLAKIKKKFKLLKAKYERGEI